MFLNCSSGMLLPLPVKTQWRSIGFRVKTSVFKIPHALHGQGSVCVSSLVSHLLLLSLLSIYTNILAMPSPARESALAIFSTWNSLPNPIHLDTSSSTSALCSLIRESSLSPDSVIFPYCKVSLPHVLLLCSTSTVVISHVLVLLCA